MKKYKPLYEMSRPKDEYQKLIWGDVSVILIHFVKLAFSKKEIADKFHPDLFQFLKQFRKGWQSTINQSLRALYRTLSTRNLKVGSGKKENVLREVVYDIVVNIPEEFKSCVTKFKYNEDVNKAIEKWDEKEYTFDYELDWYEEIRKFLSTGLLIKKDNIPEYKIMLEKVNEFINHFVK